MEREGPEYTCRLGMRSFQWELMDCNVCVSIWHQCWYINIDVNVPVCVCRHVLYLCPSRELWTHIATSRPMLIVVFQILFAISGNQDFLVGCQIYRMKIKQSVSKQEIIVRDISSLFIIYLKFKFNLLISIIFGNPIPWRNGHLQHWGRGKTTRAENILLCRRKAKYRRMGQNDRWANLKGFPLVKYETIQASQQIIKKSVDQNRKPGTHTGVKKSKVKAF